MIQNEVSQQIPTPIESREKHGIIGAPVRKRFHGTILTERQWEVIRYRAQGITQTEVAKKLDTSRENVSIIEHRALLKISKAKATLAALQQMNATRNLLIPSGTSVYGAIESIILRADILGIKLRNNCDDIIASIRSKCKGKIREHHLVSAVSIEITVDGHLVINADA